jgi:hypothetical protein
MTRSATRISLLAAASLLLPLGAPGESRLAGEQSGSRGELAAATAHVLFKIVIPQELAMDFPAAAPARLTLTKAGHRAIARFETCTASNSAQSERGLNCTVSMP